MCFYQFLHQVSDRALLALAVGHLVCMSSALPAVVKREVHISDTHHNALLTCISNYTGLKVFQTFFRSQNVNCVPQRTWRASLRKQLHVKKSVLKVPYHLVLIIEVETDQLVHQLLLNASLQTTKINEWVINIYCISFMEANDKISTTTWSVSIFSVISTKVFFFFFF